MQRKDIKPNDAYKKIGKPIKEILPQEVKQINIRESIPMKFPEGFEPQFTSPIIPNTPYEEWPGDNIALSFDFGLESNTQFTDNLNHLIIFPLSLRNDTIRNVIWLRPHEYVQKILTNQNSLNVDKEKLNNLLTSTNCYNKNSNQHKITQRLERRNTLNHITNNEANEYLSKQNEINDKLSYEKLQHLQLYIVKHKEIIIKQEEIDKAIENRLNQDRKSFSKARASIKATQPLLENETILKSHFEPDPSNIYMNRYYCKYSKWLASVYQVIQDQKIHDVNNEKEKTIQMKIYPQQNGIPIYNPNGRYWVKLYHMGKYRKIEIDDQIPLNRNYDLLFPQCEDIKELWPILITKALMKLYSHKHRNYSYDQIEVGDCSPIYSLTGYICTSISSNILFDNFIKNPNDNLLKAILSDENYTTKGKMIIAFKKEEQIKTMTDNDDNNSNLMLNNRHDEDEKKMFNDKLPVNTSLKIPSISRDIRNKFQRLGTTQLKRPENLVNMKMLKKKNKKQTNGIYYDIAYSLIELFSSQQFNLRCLFPLSFSDLKLNFNVKYKQMPPEEKKIYITQLKALRKLQIAEKEKRINEWKTPGNNEFLVKIANNAIDKDNQILSDIQTEFTSLQIEIIKKCLLNSLKYPPIDYFIPTFLNQVYKDEESGEINFWTMRFYSKFLQREGQVETEESPYITPSIRNEGKWLSYNQLIESFNNFIVLTNPSLYKNKLMIDNIWYNYNSDFFEENDSTRMISLKGDNNNNRNDTKGNIIIIFEPNGEKNYKSNSSQLPQLHDGIEKQRKQNQFDDIDYSLNLQLYLITNNNSNKADFIKMNNVSLCNSLCTTEINDLDYSKEYFLNIKGGIIPFGYTMHMYSSNFQMIPYSYQQFLVEFKGYSSKRIQLSHPSLEKGRYYLLSRIKLCNKGNEELNAKFYTLFIGYENKNIRENIEVFLINSITNNKKRICLKELFNVSFLKDESYLIELSIVPPFIIKDTTFEFEIVCSNKGDIIIEAIDMIHPIELQDMFLPNKHGISTELSIASLDIQMEYHPTIITETAIADDERTLSKEEEMNNKNEQDKKQINQTIQQEKKKGEDVRMIVEFYENNKKIFSKSFINKTIIRNLVLKRKDLNLKTTQDLTQYQLTCYLDSSECPKCLLKASEYHSDYFWHIRLFSSDTVCFVRNTMKEDNEREMIRSWEINQIGRGEKSRLARQKYLLIKKTEQESKENKLNAIIESHSDMIITNIPPSSNNINPFKDFSTPLPTIESYNSLFLKNFFIYSTKNRVIINNTSKRTKSSDPLPKISNQYCRTKEDHKIEKDTIIEKYDQYYQIQTEANNEYEIKKRQFSNDIETMNEKHYTYRHERNKRNKIKIQSMITEALLNEMEFENQLEILEELVLNDNEGKSTKKFDFTSAYNQLKSTLNIKQVKMNRQKKVNEAVRIMSLKKEEMIRNDLVNGIKNCNPQEIAKKHLNDLNENILHVSNDLIRQLKNIQSC